MLRVKAHVLRYWETQFSMLRPKKNRAGNRMYRPEEVRLLLRIKELLYDRRYTIAGARRTLLDERKQEEPQVELGFNEAERKLLVAEVKEEVLSLLAKLKRERSGEAAVGGERPAGDPKTRRAQAVVRAGSPRLSWPPVLEPPLVVGRGVAQLGSAPAWGAGGRWFKSSRPDHSSRRGHPRAPGSSGSARCGRSPRTPRRDRSMNVAVLVPAYQAAAHL